MPWRGLHLRSSVRPWKTTSTSSASTTSVHDAKNSLIASLSATLASLVLGSLGANGLARYRFRGQAGLAYWILSLRMTPAIASVIPLFILSRNARLIDTLLGLVIGLHSV